jgi:hypothetical protein
MVEDFLIRRRSGRSMALDTLVLQFRPCTHVARRVRRTAIGEREKAYEIYLRASRG